MQANVGNMKLLVTQALLISYNLISIMLTRLRTNGRLPFKMLRLCKRQSVNSRNQQKETTWTVIDTRNLLSQQFIFSETTLFSSKCWKQCTLPLMATIHLVHLLFSVRSSVQLPFYKEEYQITVATSAPALSELNTVSLQLRAAVSAAIQLIKARGGNSSTSLPSGLSSGS